MSNGRVAAENFQQHAEHYTRLLSEAQREIDMRREEQERLNRERQAERDRERAERQERESAAQPEASPQDVVATDGDGADDDSGLVETPENQVKSKRAPRRKPRPKPDQGGDAGSPLASGGDTPEAAE